MSCSGAVTRVSGYGGVTGGNYRGIGHLLSSFAVWLFDSIGSGLPDLSSV